MPDCLKKLIEVLPLNKMLDVDLDMLRQMTQRHVEIISAFVDILWPKVVLKSDLVMMLDNLTQVGAIA